MASLQKAVEEPLDILCEFRRYKALEAAGNNDNKNPTASSVEQVRIQWFLPIHNRKIQLQSTNIFHHIFYHLYESL